ncbi:MAG TPA: hypothetical protein VGM39_19355 [Kofleriaceae bacterium]
MAALGASGCGFGIRAGTSVSKTTSAAKVTDLVNPTSTSTSDGSISQTWMELESFVDLKYFRVLSSLGGGEGGARFRVMDPGGGKAIDGPKYNWFDARTALGAGFATGDLLLPYKLIGYGMYNTNFAKQAMDVQNTIEIGVRLELSHRFDERTTSNFNVGLAMVREEGQIETIQSGSNWEGTFHSQGYLVTFGWHYGLEHMTPD